MHLGYQLDDFLLFACHHPNTTIVMPIAVAQNITTTAIKISANKPLMSSSPFSITQSKSLVISQHLVDFSELVDEVLEVKLGEGLMIDMKLDAKRRVYAV